MSHLALNVSVSVSFFATQIEESDGTRKPLQMPLFYFLFKKIKGSCGKLLAAQNCKILHPSNQIWRFLTETATAEWDAGKKGGFIDEFYVQLQTVIGGTTVPYSF